MTAARPRFGIFRRRRAVDLAAIKPNMPPFTARTPLDALLIDEDYFADRVLGAPGDKNPPRFFASPARPLRN